MSTAVKTKKKIKKDKPVKKEKSEWDSFLDGVGAVKGVVSQRKQQAIPVISTRSLGLDMAFGRVDHELGTGGIPLRSALEIFGPPGVFKSGTLSHIHAEVQARGYKVIGLYTEEPHFELDSAIGVDIDDTGVMECWYPMTDDERINLAEKRMMQLAIATKNPEVGLVFIDSIKGLVSAKQTFEDGDSMKGEQRDYNEADPIAIRAKLLEKFFNDIKTYNRNAIVILTNQWTDKIKQMGKFQKRTEFERIMGTGGGSRKEFESVFRLGVDNTPIYKKGSGMSIDLLKKHEPIEKWRVDYRVVKNRFAEPRKPSVHFLKEELCFDKAEEVLKYGAAVDLIERSGNFYKFNGETYNGAGRAAAALRAFPSVMLELEKQIIPFAPKIFGIQSGNKQTVRERLGESFLEDDDDE